MSEMPWRVRVALSDHLGWRSVEAPGKEFEDVFDELSCSGHGKATVVLSPLRPSKDRWIDSNTYGEVMSHVREIPVAHDLVLDLFCFRARAGALLADVIARSATLNGLALKYCSIPPDDWEAVCESLKCNSSLQSVRLVECDIELDSFAGALKANGSISDLTIAQQQLGDSGASQIASALQDNSTLRELHMRSCCFGAEGSRSISDALKRRECSLVVLDLSHNRIGDYGANAVAELLQTSISIQNLDLTNCSIGESGAKAIAEALDLRPRGPHVKEIHLSGNSIRDEGAKAFSDLLRSLHIIEELYLPFCDIRLDGMEALRDALFVNHHTQVLDLDGNFHQLQRNGGNWDEVDEDNEDEETFEKSEEVERHVDKLLALNKKGPLVAEVWKTFIFPRGLAGMVEATLFPTAVEKVAQISGEEHQLSILFTFIRECPICR